MSDPVSRLDLERLIVGDLEGPNADALRARIDADPDLARRFQRLSAELSADVPLPALVLPAASDEEPAQAPRPSGFPRWASLGTLAVLLAAAVALIVARLPDAPADPTVFRGTFDLEVVRVRNGDVQPVGMLVQARNGDRIQLVVRPGDPSDRVSVFDVQDDGVVSEWAHGVSVGPDGTATVSAILDDYAGLERVYVLVGPEPVDPVRFERSIEASWGTPLADLDVVPGLKGVTQRSVLVLEDP